MTEAPPNGANVNSPRVYLRSVYLTGKLATPAVVTERRTRDGQRCACVAGGQRHNRAEPLRTTFLYFLWRAGESPDSLATNPHVRPTPRLGRGVEGCGVAVLDTAHTRGSRVWSRRHDREPVSASCQERDLQSQLRDSAPTILLSSPRSVRKSSSDACRDRLALSISSVTRGDAGINPSEYRATAESSSSKSRRRVEGVLTPLYVKTRVQATWMSSWRARKSVMTRW